MMVDYGRPFFSVVLRMNRSAGAAAKPSESDRKRLGVRALAGSDTIGALAEQLDVSRKFVYSQAHKVDLALDNVFFPAAPDDEVLFHLPVTKTWLRQATLAQNPSAAFLSTSAQTAEQAASSSSSPPFCRE